MENDANRTMENCRFLKAVLMVLVILGHSCAFWADEWFIGKPIIDSSLLKLVYGWLNSFHIYTFVLISGYIFTYKIDRGGYSEFALFLKNKAKRLLLPYIFTTIVWVVPISVYYFHWDLEYLIKKFVLAINPSQLWFLWMLFWVFIIAWVLNKVTIRKTYLEFFIVAFFYGIGSIGVRFFDNFFCIWSACIYLPFFYIGTRIRRVQEIRKLYIENIPAMVWLVLDIFIFMVSQMILSQIQFPGVGLVLGLLTNIVGSISAFMILQKVADKINWSRFSFIGKMITYTMPMYLFHQQIIYFTLNLFNGKVHPYINVLINFTCALMLCFIISTILMRFKLSRLMLGEK